VYDPWRFLLFLDGKQNGFCLKRNLEIAYINGVKSDDNPRRPIPAQGKMKIPQKRQRMETLPEGAWQTVLDFARRALASGCLFRSFLAPYPPKGWRLSDSFKKKGYRLMWTGKIQATIQPDIFDISQIP
jgi:hypothetical protein